MSSIFKRASFHIVGKLGTKQNDNLIPVSSPFGSEKFKPLCLIRRKRSNLPWKKFKYIATPFILENLLEDGKSVNIEVETMAYFSYSEICKSKFQGNVNINVDPANVNVTGSRNGSDSITVALKKSKVNIQQLEDCVNKTKLNIKHHLIRGLQKARNEFLCVVTEAIMTEEELRLEKSSEVDGSLKVAISGNLQSLSGSGGCSRKLTVPMDTVLAYAVFPIRIQPEDGQFALCYVEDKKLKSSFEPDGFENVIGELTDFNQVKTNIARECRELQNLANDVSVSFLKTILDILEDSDSLPAVEEMLDQILSGEEPDFTIFSESGIIDEKIEECIKGFLQDIQVMNEGNDPEQSPVKPLHLLFSALSEIQEETLSHLVTCLKMKMTSQELQLVECVWNNTFSIKQELEISVDVALVSGMTEEQLSITTELLNTCGVKLQREESVLKCIVNEAAQLELCKLYTALYIFNILSS